MRRPARFTVYTVLQDGNVNDVLKTDSATKAVARLHAEWKKYEGIRHRHHGVCFTDNPEYGDIGPSDLADLVSDEKAQGLVWAVLLGAASLLVTIVFWAVHLYGHR